MGLGTSLFLTSEKPVAVCWTLAPIRVTVSAFWSALAVSPFLTLLDLRGKTIRRLR